MNDENDEIISRLNRLKPVEPVVEPDPDIEYMEKWKNWSGSVMNVSRTRIILIEWMNWSEGVINILRQKIDGSGPNILISAQKSKNGEINK